MEAAAIAPEEFRALARLLYQACGIRLQPGKEQLVRSRLWKRIRTLGLQGFDDYLALVCDKRGIDELSYMVDALTTNKTSFYREPEHFALLGRELAGWFEERQSLRVWSAGCSSGEEPYTIAITLLESLPDGNARDAKILATDISTKVLAAAKEAIYCEAALDGVSEPRRRRFFSRERGIEPASYSVGSAPRSLVQFARLNLMGRWPMKGPFDFVFCRNVMIYFDRETQETLIQRFHEILRPGGLLFVGLSESLTGKAHTFEYVAPGAYRK